MFGKRKNKPMVVVAKLNARLMPLDRGEIEDALDAVMTKRGYAARVVGGGTQMAANGEVSHCDIEIELDHPSDELTSSIMRMLESMLAPKGSRLHFPDRNQSTAFGRHEGLALYLNGTDLSDEVYRSCDSNHVYEECGRLLSGIGRVASHWQGPTETALYAYGTEFKTMRERLMPLLQTYPLCRQCRVEQIA
jgi:hypothetical protein